MNVYAAIALCFAPLAAAFLLMLFFAKMKIALELRAVLLGLAAVLPISFLQFYAGGFAMFHANSWRSQLLRAILISGLIEELIKMVALFFLPSRKLMLRDFFLCCLLCGVGLACFESAIYFLQSLQRAQELGARLVYRQIFMRMFTTDIVHALCAGLGGLFARSLRNRKADALPFVMAVLLHGVYDFFALYDALRWLSVVAILMMAAQCRISYGKARETAVIY